MGLLSKLSSFVSKACLCLKNKPATSTTNTEDHLNEHAQPDVAEEHTTDRQGTSTSIPFTWRSMFTMASIGHLLLRPPTALAPWYLLVQGRYERRLESLEATRVAIANFFVRRATSLLEGVPGSNNNDVEQGRQTSVRRGRTIELIVRQWLPTTMIIVSMAGLLALFLRTVHYMRWATD